MTHPQEFKGKYIVQGKIRCETGLHIGGSDTGIEIGGLDNPVIKDPITDRPYIPGSSLKGKLRAIMEWSLGLIAPHPKHGGFQAYDCCELQKPRDEAEDAARWDAAYTVGRLFGAASDEDEIRAQAGPTRLTVRDAFLDAQSAEALVQTLGEGVYTEIKTENTLDRVTSAANPRPIERVPAGADFAFTLIVDIYQDADRDLLPQLFGALAILEDSGLGGGVSRGHGQISFCDLAVEWRSRAYYTDGKQAKSVALTAPRVRDIAAGFNAQEWV